MNSTNPMNPMNPTNSTNPMNPTNPIRLSILGAGNWGKNHVRVFCTLLGNENVIVCDPDESRREAMLANYSGIRVSPDPVFTDVDAVVIATPAVTHFKLARQALLAGKHVLVEKPLTMTSQEGEELVNLAEERGRILMVDHLLEYHPAVVTLKKLVDKGELGKLLHLTSERLNLGVIRSEENALWSLAPHDISVILYLLGEEPVEVAAHGAAYLQSGIEDVCYLTMRFASGALGHVHVSWLDPIKTRRLSVVGKRKMAVYDDMQKEKLVLLDQRAEQVEDAFQPVRGDAKAIQIDAQEPLRRMAETFIEGVRTGVAPLSDGLDGLRVVRVLEAAQRALDRSARMSDEGSKG